MRREREKRIIKASVIGMLANFLLVIFKLIVGLMSNSIAIVLDAINNATDALSSIITIVGTKIAGMRPNRHHPFGYGRTEYLTSAVIATIIIVAGALSLRESIEKIAHPASTNYTSITITVIIVAIIAKILIGIYFHRTGKEVDSQALMASATDSNYDAVLSAGTLLVALAQIIWSVNIDGIVGLIISVVILKAGFDVLKDAISPIIGVRDEALGTRIYKYVNSMDGVCASYDLLLDNFGPNKIIASMNIEVPEDMNARQIHELTRTICTGLREQFNVIATVGIYAENPTGEFAEIRRRLDEIVRTHPEILQIHGFYVDNETHTVYFDMVMDFKSDAGAIEKSVIESMSLEYPSYSFNVVTDTDFEGCENANGESDES